MKYISYLEPFHWAVVLSQSSGMRLTVSVPGQGRINLQLYAVLTPNFQELMYLHQVLRSCIYVTYSSTSRLAEFNVFTRPIKVQWPAGDNASRWAEIVWLESVRYK